MTIELTLPELAESMTSATVTAWLKQPGERVVQGDPLVEVDTDVWEVARGAAEVVQALCEVERLR